MARPPEGVEPSELFKKLLERPKPSDVWPFPRLDADGEPVFWVRIFVLNETELDRCRDRARAWAREKLGKDSDSIALTESAKEAFGDRVAKEILAAAVHQDKMIPGTEEKTNPTWARLFRNVEDIGELTADEWSQLYGSYLTTQHMYGPTDDSFESIEEVNDWVARLSEGGKRFLLSLLRSHQRDELLLRLVERAYTLSTLLQTFPDGSLPESLESMRSTWLVGIDSSTELAAESTDSQPELITQEEAMQKAIEARAQHGADIDDADTKARLSRAAAAIAKKTSDLT